MKKNIIKTTYIACAPGLNGSDFADIDHACNYGVNPPAHIGELDVVWPRLKRPQ